jgi:hypothetical protein
MKLFAGFRRIFGKTEVTVMKILSRLFFALFLFAGSGLSQAALAEELSSADRDSIKAIVSHQLEAFQRDDGAGAYSYASPTIKGLYPNADIFMQMVKQAYQPVYRPQSVTFGQVTDSPYGVLQKVFLTGPDGKSYVAVYSMERQPDGSWLINGCSLVEDHGATI